MEGTEISVIEEGWFTILAQRKRELDNLSTQLNGSSASRYNKLIALFGSSTILEGSEEWDLAYQIGEETARGGMILMNGGYGGLMEASAAGARSEGGVTVGVTCDKLPARRANRYIEHQWHLDRWDQRLMGMIWLADGYIVMPGSSGTLVELSMVIETQSKGFIPSRPIVCIGDHWESVVSRIARGNKVVSFAYTAEECMELMT
ncbi:MAG: LOG family protein [Candidatus Electryoneaceae bacterium]|nr:LOG family protein [Candidatus Electryoneaceae bacterium]